jgi:tetratricopeptide (TPR) repeat protein
MACQALGKTDEARAAFQEAVRHQPGHADALFRLGSLLADQGQRAEAVVQYRAALQAQPDHADALLRLGVALAELGQLDEAIPRLQAAVQTRPDSAPAHYNLGVALAEKNKLNEAAQSLQEALRLRPNYAAAYYSLGNVLQSQGKRGEAMGQYRRALECKPDYFEAYNNLGLALFEERKREEAVVILEHAARLRPNSAEAQNNLGMGLVELGRFAEAEACYRQALRLNPQFVDAHNNLGSAFKEQGRLEEALASYQVALWLNFESASTHWNRSLALLRAGQFAEGWAEYEWRWKRKKTALRRFPQPAWDGSPLAGRTLLIYMEQGLGDMIQFIRFAALAREGGGRVVVECPPVLQALFSGCAGIDELVVEGSPLPPFDVHIPLMSLPYRLGTKGESIPAQVPYLTADPERLEFWGRQLGGLEGHKIGITWQGNPHHQWDHHRSFPLAGLAPVASVPGVRLISLQKGPGTEQLGGQAAGFPVMVLEDEVDPPGRAFADTAAIMRHLDLVITTDTAMAHLAGGLAVPVWLALSKVSDWRWLLEREDSPWYPTMRLFRQTELGNWKPVFARMAEELQPLLGKKHDTKI